MSESSIWDAWSVRSNGPALKPLTVAELLGVQAPRRQMALAPILPLPGLAMLYAPRGMGKTYLALSIAAAIADGGKLLRWQAPAPRRVLYIDGEMPTSALQDRIASIALGSLKLPPDDGNLRFLAADLMDGGMPSLTRPEVQRAVQAASAETEVLIFDNLSTLAGGLKENESDDWEEFQRWLLALRRAGKLVLFVHHAGKGGQQRGTSRREDVLDTVIALRRPKDYQPNQGARVEVHIEKARGVSGEGLEPFLAWLVPADEQGALDWRASDLVDAQHGRAAEMLRDGMHIRDVAEEVGLSKSTVHRIKQQLGTAG